MSASVSNSDVGQTVYVCFPDPVRKHSASFYCYKEFSELKAKYVFLIHRLLLSSYQIYLIYTIRTLSNLYN
jgi:hypothetical protein